MIPDLSEPVLGHLATDHSLERLAVAGTGGESVEPWPCAWPVERHRPLGPGCGEFPREGQSLSGQFVPACRRCDENTVLHLQNGSAVPLLQTTPSLRVVLPYDLVDRRRLIERKSALLSQRADRMGEVPLVTAEENRIIPDGRARRCPSIRDTTGNSLVSAWT
ncbi:hypothetical protein ACFT8P_13020 [Streptomyces sp. NPDC057101]|uniref:hypothetical protein n=1 Tax=Streptomyces sp. NPDC057101 TaxID=3346020 RepID=UPI003624D54C